MALDHIYEIAFLKKSEFPDLTNKQAIRLAIYDVLNAPFVPEETIGIEPYLDYLNTYKKFKNGEINCLMEELKQIRKEQNYPNISERQYLEEMYYYLEVDEQASLGLNYLIAENIRKEHFPSSGLESVIIANGGLSGEIGSRGRDFGDEDDFSMN